MAGFIAFTKEQFDALDRLLGDLRRRAGNVLKGTESGTTVTAADAYAAPPLSLTVNGRSVQSDTPTPSTPVEIKSVESVVAHVSADGTTDATGWPVTIDLQGHALRSLPDGTHDELTVDADGHVTLVQRVGTKSTFTPITINAQSDGTTSWEALPHSNTNIRTAMSNVAVLNSESTSNRLAFAPSSNALYARLPTSLIGTTAQTVKAWADANMTLTYALITPVTHDLGTINLPDTPAPDLTAWAQTDPDTGIALTYERDINLAWPSE